MCYKGFLKGIHRVIRDVDLQGILRMSLWSYKEFRITRDFLKAFIELHWIFNYKGFYKTDYRDVRDFELQWILRHNL